MNLELMEEIAKHIEGERRTKCESIAQIASFERFKSIIATDVEFAKSQLAGNLPEIVRDLGKFEEYQADYMGRTRSAVEILIDFFCKRWGIEPGKLAVD